ncbi:hypothetical protein EDB89DRAFT_978450 [Lactarius sanguifluus]|nr:hypothetical protein EDB89DRAFT_978450 [Lactarius sanguifluus]
MTSVHFKLSISNGLTRRISFPTRPSWNELAARIQALYNIPLGRLGVSYVDSDGDEVTLSSEEELRDFYDTVDTGQRSQLIKLRVVELSSGRIAEFMAEATTPPLRSSIRNTFGGPNPLVFDMDQDWERLPLGGLYIPPLDREVDSPHAFVEVVDDEVEKDNGSVAGVGGPPIGGANKGKTRDLRAFVEDDVSSSTSVIADETPTKPPIHVQVHGLRQMNSSTFGSPPAASTPAHESVTSTPTALPPTLSENSKAHPISPSLFPDPPTPELGGGGPSDPNISLSNDLASLLNSLNSMFVEHPEVGQHLRALLRNVGNGSYWDAQRETVARVAEDIQRVARDAQTAVAMGAQEVQRRAVHEAQQVRQQAQQEAARRVTEAVGNIFRVFGAGGAAPTSEPGAGPDANVLQAPVVIPPSPIDTHMTSPSAPPGGFPLHGSPSVANPRRLSSHPSLPTASTPSTAIPPPLQSGVPPPPRIVPPPPLVNEGGIAAWNQFKPFSGASPDTPSAGPSSSVAPPEVSYYAFPTNRRTRPSASELKASLEAAKSNYKTKKDEYRQEQEARRRERRLAKEGVANNPISPGAQPVEVRTPDSMGPSDAGTSRMDPATTMPPPIQIISNARGKFPQLEMVNLPRSPTKQRVDRSYHEGDKAWHVDTVVGRLEGMGFHEATYPTLRTVVESHLPSDGTRITKEVEDDVMSEVLERLLETSGSGAHSTP